MATDISAEVRDAVIAAYAEHNRLTPDQVAAGFTGGLEFDSLLGVEMACSLEERLGVSIPEEKLAKASMYKSLDSFAAGIQSCVEDAKKTGKN